MYLQHSVGLPDVHSGYGFAIGNMAAFDTSDPQSVVSPGMIVWHVCASLCMYSCEICVFVCHRLEPIKI